ncbi:TPA: YihY family inner membrane protein [Neisseria gonorrhoeae]|uniref:YihY family inner membrane protein n=1 Tax=Neisseria gonorrhoeae TaxID=485 RepID=UPI0001AF7BED|nr:YihY family inner membrane protein [Neisseria gonorrhoeae]AKP11800.1 ribonuclease BN/unknown domain fusion protein [Neisseria gonorrhoeae]EEZ44974.1 membrane protein [Neisseria gonorrhoeae FA19]
MTFLQRWQGLADNKICAFAWFVIRRFSEERVPQAAASMTFTTLLALVPVLTVMVAVASIFPVFDRWSDSFVSFVNQTIVPQGADMVFDYIDAFRDQANRLTAIGSVMLVVTSLMLIRTIDNAFNRIWRVNTQRPWMMQFLVYWALLTFGPLSLGVGISFMVGSVQDSVLSSGAQQWADALKTAARLAFMTVLLWGLYRFVPNRFVPARQAFVGALITAFCLETARFLFTWYMGNFDGYRSIYGAFAAVPFFLLWLNLLWTLVLGGAVLTSSLSYWQGEAFRRGFDSRGRFDDVLKILLLLDAAQKEGKALPVPEFRRHINMGYDELGELLEKLARHGYIYSGRQGWVLKTGADSIELSELFKLFVYRPLPVERDHVNQAVDTVMTPCLQTLNMTLAEFDAQAKKQQQS